MYPSLLTSIALLNHSYDLSGYQGLSSVIVYLTEVLLTSETGRFAKIEPHPKRA